jgi:hypothetical protein
MLTFYSGHFTIGGDPGGDVFISPSDPVRLLHLNFLQAQDHKNFITAVEY